MLLAQVPPSPVVAAGWRRTAAALEPELRNLVRALEVATTCNHWLNDIVLLCCDRSIPKVWRSSYEGQLNLAKAISEAAAHCHCCPSSCQLASYRVKQLPCASHRTPLRVRKRGRLWPWPPTPLSCRASFAPTLAEGHPGNTAQTSTAVGLCLQEGLKSNQL